MSGEWVYVSGPVTGMPGGNRAAFEEAASRLEAAGFRAVVPTRFTPEDEPWHLAMRRCVSALCACHGLAYLPGATTSRGASVEMSLALKLLMPVMPVDAWCLKGMPPESGDGAE